MPRQPLRPYDHTCTWLPGMMGGGASPQTTFGGGVSLLVTNTGVIRHERVVLPLTGSPNTKSRRRGLRGSCIAELPVHAGRRHRRYPEVANNVGDRKDSTFLL